MYIKIENKEVVSELKKKSLKAGIEPDDLATAIVMRYTRERKAKEAKAEAKAN